MAVNGGPLQAVLQGGRHLRLIEKLLQEQLEMVQLLFRQGLVLDLEPDDQFGEFDPVDPFDECLQKGAAIDVFGQRPGRASAAGLLQAQANARREVRVIVVVERALQEFDRLV